MADQNIPSMSMKEQAQEPMLRLQEWLDAWPTVRQEIEGLMESYAQSDPTLHFELAFANLELKDLDESVKRVRALGRLLSGGDLSGAELKATGNR